MKSLTWKLRRLRRMSGAEVGYRLYQAGRARAERAGLGLARHVPMATQESLQSSAQCGGYPLPHCFDKSPYIAAADAILAGRFDVFALCGLELGFPPRWNRDPKTGTEAPLTFGKTLDYRDERIVGNIKYLWEPNRHLELVTLAQAWHLTGDVKYSQGACTLLQSWFEQCPYPLGPNWTSALEHGVRLVNWAITWQLLGAQDEPFRRRWLDSIYRHCRFIVGHFSRHSSANNHLLGELMGLFVASLMWPCWPESARWREDAKRRFEEQALVQNAPDGVNREQAVWYHHEVADMMLLCGLLGRSKGVEFSAAFWRRLEAMTEFIAALRDAGGHTPAIGDADDAVMVRFSREPNVDVFGSLLATGAVLFDRADFKAAVGYFDDKSRWLLGDQAAEQFAALPATDACAPARREFREGGYWVLGCNFGTREEIRLIADAGPLGYLSIAAHGHADALAFTLSVDGREILIDPGTYAYHTDQKWRDYFRGTSAHNTVRVDGLDQSEIGGNFMWMRHAQARCERWEPGVDSDQWVGTHDGYACLSDAVIHRREIVLDKRARSIDVTDVLECAGRHDIEIFWHFAPGCVVRHEAGTVSVRSGNVLLKLSLPACDWQPQIVVGRDTPPLGWVSQRFDSKTPSTTVVWAGRISGATRMRTQLTIESNASAAIAADNPIASPTLADRR